MTQVKELRQMFDDHNGWLTLGEIMQTYLAASYRQRMTDLKRQLFREGKTIVCYPNRKDGHKSETSWRVEDLPKPTVYAEPSGQMAFIIR